MKHVHPKPLVLVLGLSLGLALAGCNKPGQDSSSSSSMSGSSSSVASGEAIAVVNGTPISKADFDEYMSRKRASEDGASVNEQDSLDELINMELVDQEALKAGLDKRPDMQAEVERRKKSLMVDTYILEWVRDAKFTDEQIKAKYDKEVARLPKFEYRARHILTKSQDEAQGVIDALKKGGDFAKLAKDKSIDPSGQRGGELGWFRPTAMVPEFASAVAQMNVGDVSSAPVQSQFGWHVIQLEEKRDSKQEVPPFEKVKDRMRTALASEAVQSYLQDLRTKAKIDVNLKPQQ